MSTLEDKLEQLDQEALGDNVQLEVIIKCMSEPLQWLDYEKDSRMSTSQQLELVRSAAWKRHVWNVVKEIIPRWTFAISGKKYRPMLEATLCLKQHVNSNISFAMAKVSLPIVIESISMQQDQSSLDTLTLYASCLNFLSLDTDIFKLYAQYTTKGDVSFFCNLICSIPGHLANVFGIQLEHVMFNAQHEWYIDRYIKKKIQQEKEDS